jgi:hypothetical protein
MASDATGIGQEAIASLRGMSSTVYESVGQASRAIGLDKVNDVAHMLGFPRLESFVPGHRDFVTRTLQLTGLANTLVSMSSRDAGISEADMQAARRAVEETRLRYSGDRNNIASVRLEGQGYAEALERAGVRTGGRLEGALQESEAEIRAEQGLADLATQATASDDSMLDQAVEHAARMGYAAFDKPLYVNANDVMADLMQDTDVWDAMFRQSSLVKQTFDAGMRGASDIFRGNYLSGVGRATYAAGTGAAFVTVAGSDMLINSYDDSSLGPHLLAGRLAAMGVESASGMASAAGMGRGEMLLRRQRLERFNDAGIALAQMQRAAVGRDREQTALQTRAQRDQRQPQA